MYRCLPACVLALLGIALLALSGCASSPPTRFYVSTLPDRYRYGAAASAARPHSWGRPGDAASLSGPATDCHPGGPSSAGPGRGPWRSTTRSWSRSRSSRGRWGARWCWWHARGLRQPMAELRRRKARFSTRQAGRITKQRVTAMSRTLEALSRDIAATVQSLVQQAPAR